MDGGMQAVTWKKFACVGKKYFVKEYILSEKIFCQRKYFVGKNILSKKIFGRKKYFGEKNIL